MTEMLTATEAREASRAIVRERTPEGVRAGWAEDARIRDAHRAWVEYDNGTDRLSEVTRAALYEKAWADGHSAGFEEVEGLYTELAELVLTAITNG